MKLRTSYFNGGVFRKNLTRFVPVWVLYTVFMMLVMLTYYTYGNEWTYLGNVLCVRFSSMCIVNMLYAWLVAQVIFRDLFKSRMCNALHAMPLRREGWFFTNVASGLTFSLVPNLAVSLLMMSLLGKTWAAALVWLLVMFGQYLFFFGVAVFSVYCAGTQLGMSCVYNIVNFFSMILYAVAYLLYEPMLYGVPIHEDVFSLFSPVVNFSVDYINPVILHGVAHSFRLIPQDWVYLVLCSFVGVGFLALGLLIYRKRDLECAGNFLTVKWMKPVFLVTYTACVVLLLYSLFYLPAILSLPLGFFTGTMILERRVKVFHKKTFANFGILLGVVVLSVALTVLDPIGVTRWVPEKEDVKQVTISRTQGYSLLDLDMNDYYWNTGKVCTLSDPDEIEDIITIHQNCVEERFQTEYFLPGITGGVISVEFPDGEEVWYVTLVLIYEMDNGSKVERCYYINADSPNGQLLKAYYSKPQMVLGTDGEHLDSFIWTLEDVTIRNSESVPQGAELKSLMEAMIKDCQAGTLVQDGGYHHNESYVTTVSYDMVNGDYRYVHIYPDCENTLAWLEEHGYSLD